MSTLKDKLVTFITEAEPVWESFWKDRIESASEDPARVDALELYRGLCKNGKRMRAFFVGLGWQLAGNTEYNKDILQAACSVEALHNAFLIHDDIVDKSELRRGELAVHRQMAKKALESGVPVEDADHYGVSQAIHHGDLAQALGQQFITETSFPAERILAAIRLFDTYVMNTVLGQVRDMQIVPVSELTEAHVDYIHIHKTAGYSAIMPLMIGYRLGGGDPEKDDLIKEYAKCVGMVFQMQDDMLGILGNEAEVGKPVDSDLKEGKKTILFSKAYEFADDAGKKLLEESFANPELTMDQMNAVQELIKENGALEYSNAKARRFTLNAIELVVQMRLPEDVQQTLVEMAEYVGNRSY